MARTEKPQRYRPGTLALRRLFTKSNTRAAAKNTDHSFSNKRSMENKLIKLLVRHGRDSSPVFSILSTEEDDDEKSIITSNFPDPEKYDLPFASCHKMLLLVTDSSQKKEKFTLWNPSTNDFETLPRPPHPLHSLAPGRFYGLGLDPKTTTQKDFKVLRFLVFECMKYGNVVELCSLKTKSWKRIPYPHGRTIPCLVDPIYINGFNYWTAATGIKKEDLVIVSFDFANESFPALIPRPNEAYKIDYQNRYCFLLAEFEGSLALVVYDKHEKQLVLWVWNKEVVSWSRKEQVWTVDDVFIPLAFLKNHLFYFQDTKRELVLFDCAKQKLKKNFGVEDVGTPALIAFPVLFDYVAFAQSQNSRHR